MRPVHVALVSSLAAALACSPSTTPSSFKTEGLAGTNQTVGGDLSFSLTALDDSGQQDTNYIGTVHFTSSDPLAQVPGDYPFAQDDAGEASFVVTFGTAGAQTVTATDTGTGVSTTFTVTLTDPALQALSVAGADDATLGQPFDLVVSTVDSWNSPDSFYTGTVHFTSSDSSATLPPDYTFTAADRGTHVFSGGATLQTTGATITVTDAAAQLSATATPITQ